MGWFLLHSVSVLLNFGLFAQETLDIDAASHRSDPTAYSSHLWLKFDDFLNDPDFSNQFVPSSLEAKFPEISALVPRMRLHELLRSACHLKRLHFLTRGLKKAYEDIFYHLEFFIETMTPEETSRLWGCIAGCGYIVPTDFLKRLDLHTVKSRRNFTDSLVVSTVQHLSALPHGHAFDSFTQIFSAISDLPSHTDVHNYIFLKTYLTEVRGMSIEPSRNIRAALKRYKNTARYLIKTSIAQQEVIDFLQSFNPNFAGEVFYKDLDTHLDIASIEEQVVVDLDGLHHYKEDIGSGECFRRHLDTLRDSVLLKRGWKVYRIRIDQWDWFKRDFSEKMTEQNTLDNFYRLYAI